MNRNCYRWFFLALSLVLTLDSATGQEKDLPNGRINRDTIKTGEIFTYSLSYLHPSAEEVFFPDSSFNFAPLIFRKQEVFQTRTDQTGSLDSTVYHLVSFEVTPKVGLALPVFIWNGKDCTAVYPATDSSVVALLVKRSEIDTLTVTVKPEVLPLEKSVNLTAILVAILIAAATAALINWMFGKGIRKRWNVFHLQRRYREFNRSFNRHLANASSRGSIPDVEKALVLWKNYLERLESKPFSTFTTREISDYISDLSLSEALKETDRVIYGFSSQSTDIGNSLLILNKVAQSLYLNKRKTIMGTNLQA